MSPLLHDFFLLRPRHPSCSRLPLRLIATCVLLLVTASRLPAPIHEEAETQPKSAASPDQKTKPSQDQPPKPSPSPSPTPVPKTRQAQTPKPKSSPSRVSPTPEPTPPPGKTGRFAGTWSGTMHGDNLSYPCTVVVNATETKASAAGPVFGNEGGSIRISGDTISWAWMLDSWSMTLNADSTAHVVKCCMGTIHNGSVKRIK